MVLHVLANVRQVHDALDPNRREVSLVSNTREHEQLRRRDRPGRQDQLLRRVDGVQGAVCVARELHALEDW